MYSRGVTHDARHDVDRPSDAHYEWDVQSRPVLVEPALLARGADRHEQDLGARVADRGSDLRALLFSEVAMAISHKAQVGMHHAQPLNGRSTAMFAGDAGEVGGAGGWRGRGGGSSFQPSRPMFAS